jgi:thiol:disulfide interchange protein DsbC
VLSLALVISSFAIAEGEKPRTFPLPINQMMLSEKDGRVKILSANARFEVRGELVDRWNGVTIDSADKAYRAFNYLDFGKIDFDLTELNPYYLGKGERTVMLFVDPLCEFCKATLAEIPADSTDYRFAVIPIGITSPQSMSLANHLACAKDQKTAFSQLMTGNYFELEQLVNCDTSYQLKRLLTAQIFGVQTVPYLVRHDGLIQRGQPKVGLYAWLEG